MGIIPPVPLFGSFNSAHAPLNCDDGGLLPDAYLQFVRKKAAN